MDSKYLLAWAASQGALELQEGAADLVAEGGVALLVVDHDGLAAAAEETAAAGGCGGGSVVMTTADHFECLLCLYDVKVFEVCSLKCWLKTLWFLRSVDIDEDGKSGVLGRETRQVYILEDGHS